MHHGKYFTGLTSTFSNRIFFEMTSPPRLTMCGLHKTEYTLWHFRICQAGCEWLFASSISCYSESAFVNPFQTPEWTYGRCVPKVVGSGLRRPGERMSLQPHIFNWRVVISNVFNVQCEYLNVEDEKRKPSIAGELLLPSIYTFRQHRNARRLSHKVVPQQSTIFWCLENFVSQYWTWKLYWFCSLPG